MSREPPASLVQGSYHADWNSPVFLCLFEILCFPSKALESLDFFSTCFISGLPVTISVNFNEGCSVIILKLFSKNTVLCQSNQALQALLVGGTMVGRWSHYPRHCKSVRHEGSHKIAGNTRNVGPEWTPEKLTCNPIPNWHLQCPCFESAAGSLPCKALHLLLTPFSILIKSFIRLETVDFLLFFFW